MLRSNKEKSTKRILKQFPDAAIAILGGAYIGITCGFQGTGGGLLMLFVLNILLNFEFKTAVGTSFVL